MINRDEVSLTEQEKQMEKDFEAGMYIPVDNFAGEKARLEQMVKNKKKKKSINIRVSE